MDIYILDSLLRRIDVVDEYISFLWAERESDKGDWELVTFNSYENKQKFAIGRKVVISESDRVMTVETVQGSRDNDGNETVKITGRSLEQFLDDRVGAASMAGVETSSKWELTGTPGNIAREMFKKICVDGVLSVDDKLDFYHSGTISHIGSIPEPTEEITIQVEIDTLYNLIKTICVYYYLGFRLVRKDRGRDPAELYFEVFTGDDRTTSQSILEPVVFSPDLDTLSNIQTLESSASYKDVAYVFGSLYSAVAYADNVSAGVAGFDRRVIYVDASGVDSDLPVNEAISALIQKGLEELAKNRAVVAFDGEIPQYSPYKYGVDYRLGDLVEMRNTDGTTNNMRVTEQIFASDAEGDRSYPTLTFDLLITPGSWAAWGTNEYWIDADGTWLQQN